VVTPATSSDLTVLANVKAELGITTGTEDANIETWIDQASAACTAYCNRVFAQETVSENIRRLFLNRYREQRWDDVIQLARYPVTAIGPVVEDTVTLVLETDYTVDYTTGKLYRLSSDGISIMRWTCNQLTVPYTAGYALLGSLPFNIERACITMVKLLRNEATRDPTIKEENIPGVLQTTYGFGVAGDDGALPPTVTALLDPFREVSV
jgi:hypothetical protein